MIEEDRPQNLLDRDLVRKLLVYVWPHKRTLTFSLLLLPFVALFDLLQPMMIKLAIDRGITDKSVSQLDTYVFYFLLCMIGAQVVGFAQMYLLTLSGQRASHDLRNATFRHLISLKASFFDRQPVGRLVTRVTSDVDALNEMFASGIVSLVGDALTLVGITCLLFYLNWQLALVCMIAAPVLAVSAEVFRRLLRGSFRLGRKQLAAMGAFLNEHVTGMSVVQSYCREARAEQRFAGLNESYRASTFKAAAYDAALYAWVEALSTYVVAILLWFSSSRISMGALTFGTLVAFYRYLDRFFVPLRDLSAKYAVMQSAFAAAERIFGLLSTNEVIPEPRSPVPLAPIQTEIRFEDVSFSYAAEAAPPDAGKMALCKVNFSIQKGKKVAVVGHTGSGKSTLARLLLRQYEVTKGRILVDGVDIRDVGKEAHRSRFAVVLQDVHLFAGTLGYNVSLGADYSTERMLKALSAVQAEGLVVDKGGLLAKVEERGSNFSLGEKQLLSFARALCRDPEVLVLDEATASVDSETEARLQAALDVLLEGRTALIIAHRLSTVRRCDEILVMHKGCLVERGTHDELYARGGRYAKLCDLQLSAEGP